MSLSISRPIYYTFKDVAYENYKLIFILLAVVYGGNIQLPAQQMVPKTITLTQKAKEQLAGKQILYIEREQYAPDHHNTATLFQKGEINESSFFPGGAMRIYDVDSGNITTLIELKDGVVRDPELSFDGKRSSSPCGRTRTTFIISMK